MRIRGQLLNDDRVWDIEVENGHIVAMVPVSDAHVCPPSLILPGFIDLQVNGYGGFDFNDPAIEVSGVRECVAQLWEAGITAILPTVITNAFDVTEKILKKICEAVNSDTLLRGSILGVHLEGPYISPRNGPRGAHELRFVRNPDLSEWEKMQEAAGGLIRVITLAPELSGAMEFIERVSSQGVVVAIGHTSASPETISEAISRGAKLVTHIGNGVHEYLHRHDSYIWEQLSRDELWASMICDGVHLPDRVIRSVLRCKGVSKTVLISDSLSAAGLQPGECAHFAGIDIKILEDGRIVRVDSGRLAGSGKNLRQCVKWSTRFHEARLHGAVQMATYNPACVLELENLYGSIDVEKKANFTVVNGNSPDELTVVETIVEGNIVYSQKNGDVYPKRRDT